MRRFSTTESGFVMLKAPVWWNSSHVVDTGYVPTIVPPLQQTGPSPVTDTGHGSTCVQRAVRASTVLAASNAGVARSDCEPVSSTVGSAVSHSPSTAGGGSTTGGGSTVGGGSGAGVGSGTGSGAGSGAGEPTVRSGPARKSANTRATGFGVA